jgi:hypothetical protein
MQRGRTTGKHKRETLWGNTTGKQNGNMKNETMRKGFCFLKFFELFKNSRTLYVYRSNEKMNFT